MNSRTVALSTGLARAVRCFGLTVALFAVLGVPSASGEQSGASGPELSSDRVIVEWAAGARPGVRRAARGEADVRFARDLGSRRFQLVEVERGVSARAAVRDLRDTPAVVRAVRDGYYRTDAVPNDPLFGQLWGLRNTGAGIGGFAGALSGADIGAETAWDRTVGVPGTVVAVIDSGYSFTHPDLAGVAWTNPDETAGDGIDNDSNGIVDDVHGADFVGVDALTPTVDGGPTDDNVFAGGHGVHTAGTIGAKGNNGVGISGVAQNVRLMPLRVCSRVGTDDNGCP
jgi:serine protease